MIRINGCRRLAMVAITALMVAAGCNVDARWKQSKAGEFASPAPLGRSSSKNADGTIDITIADAHEVDLVEAVVSHRTEYQRYLRELHDYYESHGYADKARWAAFEMNGFRGVRRFRYLMDAEIPSISFRPTETIEAADAMFARGLELMRSGGHRVPGIFRQDRMIEAAELFRQLIQQYPNSDKIDDAAFWCGEIHKEYLPGQEPIAVKWYERVWTWNPETEHPARFHAAVVYDYRLHDRDRALELYQATLKHETKHAANLRSAAKRIEELTKQRGQPRRSAQP